MKDSYRIDMPYLGKTEFAFLSTKDGRVRRLTYFDILMTVLVFLSASLFGATVYFSKQGVEIFLKMDEEVHKLTSERWYRYEEIADQGKINLKIVELEAQDIAVNSALFIINDNNLRQNDFNKTIFAKFETIQSSVVKYHPAINGLHTNPGNTITR